jgi:hypothetical protein
VGWRGDPAISKTIFPLIYKFSEGVPRRINLICSRLLLHGSVEQRHEIGVQDIRTVISELQGENLAAGSKFSQGDFALEDEFEQMTFAAESTEVQPQQEVHLHAVVNDSFSAPENESPLAEPNRQNMDNPVVTEIPTKRSTGIPADGCTSVADSCKAVTPCEPPEPEDVPEAELELELKPTLELEGEPEPGPDPENSIDAFVSTQSTANATTFVDSPSTVKPSSGGSSNKGAGLGTALVILLVALCVAAGYFAFTEGAWATLQEKSRSLWGGGSESAAGPVSHAQHPAPVVLIREGMGSDFRAREQLLSEEYQLADVQAGRP